MLSTRKKYAQGTLLFGTIGVAVIIVACVKDSVGPAPPVPASSYELTRSVTIRRDPGGRLVDSTVHSYNNGKYEVAPGQFDSLREHISPMHLPKAPMSDYATDAASVANQVGAIEVVDANGREGVFEIQMDGTGELVQNLRYYTNNDKVIKVNFQWTPVDDGFVATQVDQTVYSSDVAIASRVDDFSPSEAWVRVPATQPYSLALSDATKTKVTNFGRSVVVSAGLLKSANMQQFPRCDNDAIRGIAELATLYLGLRDLVHNGQMPSPDQVGPAPHGPRAIACFADIFRQQTQAIRDGVYANVWFAGQQVYRSFLGFETIFDELERGGEQWYDAYRRAFYQWTNCYLIMGSRACASVHGRWTQ